MRWARDVMAPLLLASAPRDATCFGGHKQSLTGTRWRSRHPTGSAHGLGGLFPARIGNAAEFEQRICRKSGVTGEGCAATLGMPESSTGRDNAPKATTPVTVSRTMAVAAGPPISRTRYSIDVDVHPDVAIVAVKHARQLPRFLEHHPISPHTEAAYSHAIDFVREFHRSRHVLARSGDKASLQRQQNVGGGAKEEVKSRSHLRQGQQQQRPLPVVLDSGCGTGRSSALLAKSFPHLPVIGIDRSAVRLCKGKGRTEKGADERGQDGDNGGGEQKTCIRTDDKNASPFGRNGNHGGRRKEHPPENLLLLRADLVDLWILASRDNAWEVKAHSILYPNPYPKRSQLRSRWHGHSVFPILLGLGGEITLRCNWKSYLDEVCQAVLAIHDEAGRTKGEGRPAVDGAMVGASEGKGLGTGRKDSAGEATRLGSAASELGQRNQPDLSATENYEDVATSGGEMDVGSGRASAGVQTGATVAVALPSMDVPAAVADAAASYAASARRGPSIYVPADPASTNFEAKYVAVGETVYELRLEPQLF